MPLIPFPDIPAFPGVPQLPRLPVIPSFNLPVLPKPQALIQGALGQVAGLLGQAFSTGPQWGIYTAGGKQLGAPGGLTQGGLLAAALGLVGLGGATLSTGSVDYSKETRVSDFPVERGSFASYNKVELPAAPMVTLCFAGTEGERRKFLNQLEMATKSTDLFNVVTPEIAYANYSIERMNYQRRSTKGATLLVVELSLKEIRQVSAQFVPSNKGNVQVPKDAGAVPTVDNGKTQVKIPDISTLKSLATKVPALADRAQSYMQGLLR